MDTDRGNAPADPGDRGPSPIPVKNKTGNGMKSKNSKNKIHSASSSAANSEEASASTSSAMSNTNTNIGSDTTNLRDSEGISSTYTKAPHKRSSSSNATLTSAEYDAAKRAASSSEPKPAKKVVERIQTGIRMEKVSLKECSTPKGMMQQNKLLRKYFDHPAL